MKNNPIALLAFCLSLLLSCSNAGNEPTKVESKQNKKPVELVDFEEVIKILKSENGNVQVLNFWATWCAPCVKELPSFERAKEKFAKDRVDFTLVSIDFADNLESKVIPFVEKKGLKSRVILLDDTNYDSWINQISEDWDGAIPATLIVNPTNKKKKLLMGELTYERLEKAISDAL